MSEHISLLKTRRFLPLFLTQYLGAFNDNIFKNALVILITYASAEQLGADPALLVTAAAGIFILPFFLFSAIAGQLADKHSKPALIRKLKITEFILMAMAAAGFMWGNVYFLMLVLFLMGTQSSFFGPLKYSILPDLIEQKNLISANALVEAATFIAILLGTIIGGIFILKAGGTVIISILVMSVAIGGYFSSRYIPDYNIARPHLKVSYNFVTQTWQLLRQIRPQEQVFNAILGISWFWLVGFIFLAHLPLYGEAILNANEDIVTLFLTTFSVGIGIGSLFCNKIMKGKIHTRFVPWGAFGMGVAILLFWKLSPVDIDAASLYSFNAFFDIPNSPYLLLLLTVAAGFGGIYVVPLYTILQTKSDAAFRSRTIAANNIINALFMVLASIAAIFLLGILPDVAALFGLVGIGNIFVAALMWWRQT